MTRTNRRLIGSIWMCGDPACRCMQACIYEVWDDADGVEHRELFTEGEFFSDPSPMEMETLREELAEMAHRHRLEPDGFDPDVYSRDI